MNAVTLGLLIKGLLTLLAGAVLLVVGLVSKKRRHSGREVLLGAIVGFADALVILVLAAILLSTPGTRAKTINSGMGTENSESGTSVENVDSGVEISEGDSGTDSETSVNGIQTEVDFEVVDGEEPLVVETSRGCDSESRLSWYYHIVYDECDLHFLLDNCDATVDECLDMIEKNDSISQTYKNYFSDFVKRIGKVYPDANLSILYENLKTLQVIELERADFLLKSLAWDSYGCYMRTENVIYIPVGTEYIEGEWGFQVLLHEFCHAARSRWVKTDDGTDKIQFCSGKGNTMLEESMNSVFSCGLLNYEERDIAYQVPSNYLSIMLECMDNYELDDYMNHSEIYFLSKLDEYTGHTNYAQVIWNLITLQRDDWEDEKIDIPAEEFEPIYEYLCDMYYGKYITEDMSHEEKLAIADELVDKAFFDAKEDYKTSPEFFYEYLEKNWP